MNIMHKLGGVVQSLLVLLRIKMSVIGTEIELNRFHIGRLVLFALLLAYINGISLAQIPQDSWDLGNCRVINESIERPTTYWLEDLSKGLPIENSDQLLLIRKGSENTKGAIHSSDDELIAYRPSTTNIGSVAPEPPKGDIVIGLFSGRGFALKDNETHILRMNVELVKDVDPMYLRDLMTSNKSIEDIKEGLKAQEGATSLRGSLRINESSYSLLNIKLMPFNDNATAVDADLAMLYLKPAPGMIMRPDSGDKTAIAGHIKVTVAPSEGGLVGKGELIMVRDEYNGKYIVLLHIERQMPCDILPPGGGITPPSK